MKTLSRIGAVLLLFSIAALAQNTTIPLLASPQPPSIVSVTQNGVQGTTQYCYWVVAVYAGGKSPLAGPFCTSLSNGTLSASNYNIVTFSVPTSPIATPTGYDLLRTTSQTPPTGACACAVATAQAGSPLNDQSNSLSAYTVATLTSQMLIYLDNSTTTTPTLKYNLGGVVTAAPANRVFTFGPLAAGSVSQSFVVDAAYKITNVWAVEATQATAGCTVTVERLTGTTAPGSGTAQLTAAFNLQTQVINTVTTGTLVASPATFAAGADRLGIVVTGACTTLANGFVTVVATIQQ